MDSALERHYSVHEIAELWGLSPDSIRRIFSNVDGVVKVGRPETRSKRGYFVVRVPESVLLRVHAELTRKASA